MTAVASAPCQATSSTAARSGKSARQPLPSRSDPTSRAVCMSGSFMPWKKFDSRRRHVSPGASSARVFSAKALASTRPRPADVVKMRSPTPAADSKKVSRSTAGRRRAANSCISTSPRRMTAARAFGPTTASAKPEPSATTFFSTPQSSTPARSAHTSTRKSREPKMPATRAPTAASAAPTVASANSPRAMAWCTFGPMSAHARALGKRVSTSSQTVMNLSKGGTSTTRADLTRLTTTLSLRSIWSSVCGRNSPGTASTMTELSATASLRWCVAETFLGMGSASGGRYCAFVRRLLISMTRFAPRAQRRTAASGDDVPATNAIAEPNEPAPRMVTVSLGAVAMARRGGRSSARAARIIFDQ
mmetsp:Transcript_27540/g.82679  ORF Transcript_27540/g.82679 Transcript_27540/m.82679 type:complete len:361 (+) Transcript_27540:69-1151(+)